MTDCTLDARIRMARALIFDVDGTLAETEEMHRKAFNDTFACFKLPWEWDETTYGDLLKITGGKERMRHFSDAYPHDGGVITDDTIVSMHEFKTRQYKQLMDASMCPLRPGIREIIETSFEQGQKLALATTTSRSNVETLLAATIGPDGMRMFSSVVAGDEVAHKKPAPDVYLKVLAELGLAGPECIAIEDSCNGLASAMGAGIPVIVTPSFYSRDDDFAGALAIVRNLEDVGRRWVSCI